MNTLVIKKNALGLIQEDIRVATRNSSKSHKLLVHTFRISTPARHTLGNTATRQERGI